MVNAFSFCLYGPENPRYYPGMLENIALAAQYFPSWVVYVYVGLDVSDTMMASLRASPSVRLRETGILGEPNMIRRFFAIDEPDVDLMMVRDADSRIHWKDRWAIQAFVKETHFVAHTIRDHEQHTARLMGGLWGLRKSAGLSVQTEYEGYTEDTSLGHRVAHDQNFLMDVIYPKVCDRLLVHYSHDRIFPGEHVVPFPFTWSTDVFCGKIEEGFRDVRPPLSPSFVSTLPRVLTRIR